MFVSHRTSPRHTSHPGWGHPAPPASDPGALGPDGARRHPPRALRLLTYRGEETRWRPHRTPPRPARSASQVVGKLLGRPREAKGGRPFTSCRRDELHPGRAARSATGSPSRPQPAPRRPVRCPLPGSSSRTPLPQRCLLAAPEEQPRRGSLGSNGLLGLRALALALIFVFVVMPGRAWVSWESFSLPAGSNNNRAGR